MQNLENLEVFEILITEKLLKCPQDPFVRSALICIGSVTAPLGQNEITMVLDARKPDLYANNKEADPCSLISPFVIGFL